MALVERIQDTLLPSEQFWVLAFVFLALMVQKAIDLHSTRRQARGKAW